MIMKEDKIALVGASNNLYKYGNIVLKDLISKGYDIIPVNPKEQKILDRLCYSSLKDINKKIDAVIFVVPPKVTEKILNEVKELKIKKVWMQPGSESNEAIKFCEKNNINCMHNSCIMLR